MKYSATYDEGIVTLLDHQLPLHSEVGLPAKVAVVASQIGKKRNLGCSSFDGLEVLGVKDLLLLHDAGWEILCHGMTHVRITPSNACVEMGESKRKIEDALGIEITGFAIPGDNKAYSVVKKMYSDFGYADVYTIYDDVNRPPVDRSRICRVPIHTKLQGPYDSAFDPYKRIRQCVECDGYLVDYCHCPLPGRAIDPRKDCTLEELAQRLWAVKGAMS